MAVLGLALSPFLILLRLVAVGRGGKLCFKTYRNQGAELEWQAKSGGCSFSIYCGLSANLVPLRREIGARSTQFSCQLLQILIVVGRAAMNCQHPDPAFFIVDGIDNAPCIKAQSVHLNSAGHFQAQNVQDIAVRRPQLYCQRADVRLTLWRTLPGSVARIVCTSGSMSSS